MAEGKKYGISGIHRKSGKHHQPGIKTTEILAGKRHALGALAEEQTKERCLIGPMWSW